MIRVVHREHCTSLAEMLDKAPHRHNQQSFIEVKPSNECGTTGCAAGWATLWKRGIVSIAPNGVMTWRDEDMVVRDVGRYFAVRTLVPAYGLGFMFETEGAEWLGLDGAPARALFIRTAGWYRAEELAVEVLRRLGDGRLDNNTLTAQSVDELARELGHYSRRDLRSYVS